MTGELVASGSNGDCRQTKESANMSSTGDWLGWTLLPASLGKEGIGGGIGSSASGIGIELLGLLNSLR